MKKILFLITLIVFSRNIQALQTTIYCDSEEHCELLRKLDAKISALKKYLTEYLKEYNLQKQFPENNSQFTNDMSIEFISNYNIKKITIKKELKALKRHYSMDKSETFRFGCRVENWGNKK